MIHTPLCRKLARGLQVSARERDPSGLCEELDADIRSMGRTWRDFDGEDLIDVIESHSEECTHEGGYRWHLLQKPVSRMAGRA